MATPKELAALLAAINALLKLPASRALLKLNSATCERAFEAYVFSLCCRAVVRAGGGFKLHGINSGLSPNPVVFRGAPGSMASTSQDFAYAKCQLSQKTFEIHVDVEYQGTSGALHEIDVSLCDEGHANAVRATGGTPKTGRNKLLMAFECKFYEQTPGVALGRTFVGLISDCGTLRLRALVSNLPSEKLRRYLSKPSRPEPFLGVGPFSHATEERVISYIEQELRKWA
jgi:hypothetical protein